MLDGIVDVEPDAEGCGQRAAPVVVAAGGGVVSSTVDPGVPLGPGLGATWVVFHGPHVRIATASMTTAITANVRKRMRLSTLVQADLVNNVRTPSAMLIATTCDELKPLALSADAASGVASIDFRSD